MLTFRSLSSFSVMSHSAVVVGLVGCCSLLSAARSSLCLLNLSTSRVSLERLARITSLAAVLLLELISKMVYFRRELYVSLLTRTLFTRKCSAVMCLHQTHRFGFVALDSIDYLKALQFHFFQTTPWNKLNQILLLNCHQFLPIPFDYFHNFSLLFMVYPPLNLPSTGWTPMLDRSMFLTRLMDSGEGFGRDLRYCL